MRPLSSPTLNQYAPTQQFNTQSICVHSAVQHSLQKTPLPPPSKVFSKYQKTVLQLHNTQAAVPTIFVITHSYPKAVPLQAWRGPESSRKLRFPDYMKKAQDGGKIVSPTHRPPLPLGNAPGNHPVTG